MVGFYPESPRQFFIDGIYLLADGMQSIQCQVVTMPRAKKQRRSRPPFGARTPRYEADGDDSFDRGDGFGAFFTSQSFTFLSAVDRASL